MPPKISRHATGCVNGKYAMQKRKILLSKNLVDVNEKYIKKYVLLGNTIILVIFLRLLIDLSAYWEVNLGNGFISRAFTTASTPEEISVPWSNNLQSVSITRIRKFVILI